MDAQKAIDEIKKEQCQYQQECTKCAGDACEYYHAIKALEKQIPKKAEQETFHWGGKVWQCPTCESIVHKNDHYCSMCGRKLEWGKKK